MTTRPEKRARPTHLVPREGDQPFDQQLAALLRRPIHSSRVKRGRSVVSFLPIRGGVTEGRGRGAYQMPTRVLGEQQSSRTQFMTVKNAPERDDIPAFIAPFDHDGPPTEECDVPRARRIGIQRWLSWQMLLSK